MKLFRNTIIFILLSSLLAFAGNVINSRYVEYSLKKETLEFADKALDRFKDRYDPAKKTVVIIGVSTSLFSYSNSGNGKIERYSYVDILKKDINVLRFTSYLLENVSQVRILLDYLKSNSIKFDLIIFENMKYLAPPLSNSGLYNLTLINECLMYKINPNRDTSNMSKLCADLDWQLGNLSEEYSENLCLKKYQNYKQLIYHLSSKKRVEVLDLLLSCGESSGNKEDIKNFIIENYHYGFSEDVRESFKHFDLKIDPDLQEGLDINSYKPDDLIFINMYLKEFIEKYAWDNILIIPSYSRGREGLDQLPVFIKSDSKISILEMDKEILERTQKNNFKFKDNFQDGAHYNIDIHKELADKVLKFLKIE